MKKIMEFIYVLLQVTKGLIKDVILLRNPLKRYKEKKKQRGMSMYHDWIDWLGGYPFETATPEEVFNFFYKRGYTLIRLKTQGGGYGCNEFVFRKN